MLKRPSSRRKSAGEQVSLTLVPIIDTMVCLIGFLLFTTSFLAIVSIESPFPTASTTDLEERLKEKPLQLTVSVREKDLEIWSPFNRISSKTIANSPDGQPNVLALHEALLDIKTKFPYESKIVLVPHASLNYDTLISVMDSMRMVEKGDPPVFRQKKDEKGGNTQQEEKVESLFPDVIFGNLLENG